jgi:hypothetical protein
MGKDRDRGDGPNSISRFVNSAPAKIMLSLGLLLGGGAACSKEPTTPLDKTATVPGNVTKSPILETQTSVDITKMPLNTQPVGSNPTSTETVVVPTKTPEAVDYSQAFNVDPQSEADFGQVIKAPSQIDDPTDFAKWENGYLAAVESKLENYTGPFIDSDVKGGYTNKTFEFDQVLVKPIAWYKWLWKAPDGTKKTVIIKSFPIRDVATGKKSTISVTYSVDSAFGGGSYVNNAGVTGEYGTASGKASFTLWYSNIAWQKMKTVLPFNVQFLPSNSQALRMLGDFVQGRGIDPDLDKQRFIFGGYQ